MANIKQGIKHPSLFLKVNAVFGDLMIKDKGALDKGDIRGIERKSIVYTKNCLRFQIG